MLPVPSPLKCPIMPEAGCVTVMLLPNFLLLPYLILDARFWILDTRNSWLVSRGFIMEILGIF